MNKLKFLILTIFCFMPIRNLTFSSCYLLENNGNQVLILGDIHNQKLNQFNQLHFGFFKSELLKYNNVGNINCILEMRPLEFEDIQSGQDNNFYGSITLSSFASEFINSPNFFRIILADLRSEKSARIMNILIDIQSVLKKKPDEWKDINFKINILIKDYLEILESNLTKSLEIKEKYRNHSEYECFNQLFARLNSDQEQLKKILSKYDKEKFLSDFILERLKNCKDIQDVSNSYLHIRQMIIYPHSRFADIGFLDLVLQDQLSKNKTIVCVGEFHAQVLNNALKTLGYNTVASDSSVEIGENGISIKVDDDKIINMSPFIHKQLKIFLMEECQAAAASSAQSAACASCAQHIAQPASNPGQPVIRKCNFCKIQSTNKPFQQCSRCKSVHYCSIQCQKNDWSAHSKVCKHITGKHKLALMA